MTACSKVQGSKSKAGMGGQSCCHGLRAGANPLRQSDRGSGRWLARIGVMLSRVGGLSRIVIQMGGEGGGEIGKGIAVGAGVTDTQDVGKDSEGAEKSGETDFG